MGFRSRDDYERWKSERKTSEAPPRAEQTFIPQAGDLELRLSPLYAVVTLGAGAVFTVLGVIPIGKGGPTFRTLCLVVGLLALAGGVVLLKNRPVIVRMTSDALHLQGAVIPWTKIDRLERGYTRRNYWVHVHLKEKRTDLHAAALKARAILRALGDAADYDYAIMENDLTRSGIWFMEECRRRMAAAEGKA
jgi:hypothetical protein